MPHTFLDGALRAREHPHSQNPGIATEVYSQTYKKDIAVQSAASLAVQWLGFPLLY